MNKNIYPLFIALLFLFTKEVCYSKEEPAFETIRIVSYNLENLFDCEDDTLTLDDSFTPKGEHEWTEAKYRVKLNNLSRAITAAGEWDTPILIGLCEVENAKVVRELLYHTQLRESGYKFIHKDSPDQRGVDVALAYLPDQFLLIEEEFLPVHIIDGKPTRDILHASGILKNGDTLHVFVNHWPSRYGGELESADKRITAANTLREATDKLFSQNERAKIIIMGDFNDYPDNESLIYGLCAVSPQKNSIFEQLYNLSFPLHEKGDVGSHKFGGKWGMLDQIIVSGSLLREESSSYIKDGQKICMADFLLKDSATGKSPKRSFLGTFFSYGYSDHLPVYVDLIIKHTHQ